MTLFRLMYYVLLSMAMLVMFLGVLIFLLGDWTFLFKAIRDSSTMALCALGCRWLDERQMNGKV